jgi:predicted NACHT family NTPase
MTIWLSTSRESRAATLAAVVIVPPTLIGLALALWQTFGQGRRGAEEGLAEAADALAGTVERAWGTRRQRLLADDVLAADVAFHRSTMEELRRDRMAGGEARGRLSDVLAYFHRLDPPRMVIIGEAGSGKTVLVVELLMRLLMERRSKGGRAVPVLFSLTGWDGRNSLDWWISERLAEDYELSRRTVRLLVHDNWIIPVLDGLDEMEPEQPTPADRARGVAIVRQLNEYGVGLQRGPLVLTCREEQYVAIAGRHGVKDATVVHIEPLEPKQIVSYLRRRYPGKSGRRAQPEWEQVCQGGLFTAGD